MPGYHDYYTWQSDIPNFGREAQDRLRTTTALVSRVGGLGGPLAFSLAAAGVGRIILAHAGTLRPDDLNRQVLMTHGGLDTPRHDQAAPTVSDCIGAASRLSISVCDQLMTNVPL